MEHSERFFILLSRYNRKGCTKTQLQKFVELGVLTESEYEEITGEDFSIE